MSSGASTARTEPEGEPSKLTMKYEIVFCTSQNLRRAILHSYLASGAETRVNNQSLEKGGFHEFLYS